MRGLNKVTLIGNLGKKPEVSRVGQESNKRASFSMATTESYTDKNGNRIDSTEWHNIVVWGNLAEIAEKYLDKGSPIYLEGKLRTRSYEENGVKKYITEIRGESFIMLGSKKSDENVSQGTGYSQEDNSNSFNEASSRPEDDLPF